MGRMVAGGRRLTQVAFCGSLLILAWFIEAPLVRQLHCRTREGVSIWKAHQGVSNIVSQFLPD